MTSKSNHWLNPILSAFSLVLVLLGWLVFSPQKIGGRAMYIVIIGNSMEPDIKYGDLVLVLKSSDYLIGDIVAYDYPGVGTILHRIIDVDNDSYILRGDNNTWEDSYHPGKEEVIGKLWMHIPGVGNFFRQLRTPVIFTFIMIFFLGVIVLILFYDRFNIPKSYNKNIITHPKIDKDTGMDKKQSDTLYLVAVIAFIALLLAVVSFTQPITSTAADNVEYAQHGYFEYYADVPDDVFEGNVLQSGDPIFRQLNDSFEISFSYEITSKYPINIQGTYRLLAEISESSGWKRSIEIIPASLIVENSFTSNGNLDLSEIQALVDNFEVQTGITNARYTLAIIPEVIINGDINGKAIEDTFSPELVFSFDDTKLIMVENTADEGDVLNPDSNGLILGTQAAPNSISLLGLSLNVLLARIISLYILLGAMIAFYFLYQKNVKASKNIKQEDSTNV